MTSPQDATTGKKKLALKRDTIHDLSTDLLSTQGWSLWTCDASGDYAGPQSAKPRASA